MSDIALPNGILILFPPNPLLPKQAERSSGDLRNRAGIKARKAYEEAEQLAPGTEEGGYALMQAGRCHTQLKQCKKAIECYKGFLGKYKTSSHAPDALLRMAVVYVSHIGDDPSGKKILEIIAKEYPDHEMAQRAMYYLATLDLWNKRWKEAKTRYMALMERYPDTAYIP